MNLACTLRVARNRGGSHPSHSVPDTAILGVASATPYSIHISARRRYIFEAGCIAETQKRWFNWAWGSDGQSAGHDDDAIVTAGRNPIQTGFRWALDVVSSLFSCRRMGFSCPFKPIPQSFGWNTAALLMGFGWAFPADGVVPSSTRSPSCRGGPLERHGRLRASRPIRAVAQHTVQVTDFFALLKRIAERCVKLGVLRCHRLIAILMSKSSSVAVCREQDDRRSGRDVDGVDTIYNI